MTRFPLVAALAVAGALAASDASAHAYDELVPAFTTVTVTNAAGQSVDRGASHVAAGDKRHLSAAVKQLPAGAYTVDWRATDADTRKAHGRYGFTVAP